MFLSNWLKKWLSLAAAPLLLGGCSLWGGDAPESASSVPAGAEAGADASRITLPEDPDPALWVIRDADTTIYLFGTIHFLPEDLNWFDEAIRESFDASDELIVEMVAPGATEMLSLTTKLALAEDGVKLRDRLNDEERKKFEDILRSVGLPTSYFDPYEPWYSGFTLSVLALTQAGFDPLQGADARMEKQARDDGKTLSGFETYEQQLGFLDKLPLETQMAFLRQSIDGYADTEVNMDELVATWARADIDRVAELMNEGMANPLLLDVLLTRRNIDWADQIEAKLAEPGTIFIAVGAGHLAGSGSVQEVLRQRAIAVERVEY